MYINPKRTHIITASETSKIPKSFTLSLEISEKIYFGNLKYNL